jgi:hypothetical protein
MTSLVSSIAVATGIGCAMVTAQGCGGGTPNPPPGLTETQLAGWREYVELDCARCHGEYREGTRTAPPLVDLAGHWDADSLVSYLTDPNAMLDKDPRLLRLVEKYSLRMPPVSAKAPGYGDKAPHDRLDELAEYLLVDIEQPDS